VTTAPLFQVRVGRLLNAALQAGEVLGGLLGSGLKLRICSTENRSVSTDDQICVSRNGVFAKFHPENDDTPLDSGKFAVVPFPV
jgi:hypothetical protein